MIVTMKRLLILSAIISLNMGCQSNPSEVAEADTRPQLPPAKVDYGVNFLEHPWVRHQGVSEVSEALVDDLQSLQTLHEKLGIDTSFEAFSLEVMAQLLSVQRELVDLDLRTPSGLYESLNIPALDRSYYPIPWAFEVHRRYGLDRTPLGFPVYLDLRVFENVPVQEVVAWHLQLLQGGEAVFQKYLSGHWVLALGRGSRNTQQLNSTHGFSLDDRGVFLAFRQQGSRLYVWHLDAPWENAQSCLPILTETLGYPLAVLAEDRDLSALIADLAP